MVVVSRFPDAAAVADGAAAECIAKLIELLASQEEVHLMLTGGTVGIATLAAIAANGDCPKVDWERVHFWWGDERFVAANSEDRNSNQARKALLSKISVDQAKIHEFPAADELDLSTAMRNFQAELDRVKPSFDLAFLGMGPDGHIASLFPGKPEIPSGTMLISEDDSPKPPKQRLSFSYEALCGAAEIWFVVAGSDKAEAVEVAFSDEPERLPVGRVSGQKATRWFIDATAGNRVWGC